MASTYKYSRTYTALLHHNRVLGDIYYIIINGKQMFRAKDIVRVLQLPSFNKALSNAKIQHKDKVRVTAAYEDTIQSDLFISKDAVLVLLFLSGIDNKASILKEFDHLFSVNDDILSAENKTAKNIKCHTNENSIVDGTTPENVCDAICSDKNKTEHVCSCSKEEKQTHPESVKEIAHLVKGVCDLSLNILELLDSVEEVFDAAIKHNLKNNHLGNGKQKSTNTKFSRAEHTSINKPDSEFSGCQSIENQNWVNFPFFALSELPDFLDMFIDQSAMRVSVGRVLSKQSHRMGIPIQYDMKGNSINRRKYNSLVYDAVLEMMHNNPSILCKFRNPVSW